MEITATIEEQEALTELTDDNLIDELEERGYSIINSSKDIKESLINLINDAGGEPLNYHADAYKILNELRELI